MTTRSILNQSSCVLVLAPLLLCVQGQAIFLSPYSYRTRSGYSPPPIFSSSFHPFLVASRSLYYLLYFIISLTFDQHSFQQDYTSSMHFPITSLLALASLVAAETFKVMNHTVTQSSFAEPCTLQFNTATGLAGADSGFMPVAPNSTELPTFEIQINDATSPQWFFCNQANHSNSEMVFAVNAPSSGAKSFDAWVAKLR